MRRLLRWTFRVIGLLVVLAAGAALLLVFYAPGAAQRLAIEELRKLGLKDPKLTVEFIGPGRSLVRGVQLGDKRLTIGAAEAHYDPAEVWRTKRLDTIRLLGVQLRVGYRDGKLDLGELAELKLPESGGSSGGPTAGGGEIPLRRLEVRSAELHVEMPGTTWIIRVDGEATFEAGGVIALKLRGVSRGIAVDIAGRLQRTGEAISSDDLRVHVEVARAYELSPNVTADTIVIDVPLTLRASGKQVVAALPKPAEITVKALRVKGEPPIVLENVKGHLEQDGREPLVSWTAEGSVLRAAAIVALDKPLTLTTPLASGTLEMLAGWVEVTKTGDTPLTVLSAMDLRAGGIKVPGANLFVESIAASIPVSVNTDAPITRGFQTTEIVLGKDKLPPLVGSVSLHDGQINIAADWPVLSSVLVEIGGKYDAGALTLSAKIPPSKITDGRALGRLFSVLGDVEVVGTVALDAQVRVDGDGLKPLLVVDLKDAAIVSREFDIAAEGVAGGVTFTSFTPPTTPGHQSVKVRKLTFGKMELNDGEVDFRIEDLKKLFVERLTFRVGNSGGFSMYAIHFDADRPEVTTTVYVDDLNLGDWITMLSEQRVVGTGRLYGHIPISFRPNAKQKIRVGRGFIYAAPGTAILDLGSAEKVAQLLRGTQNSLSSDAQVKQQIMQALSRYEYSNFKFEFLPQPDGGTTLSVSTRGVGKGGNRVVELEGITVNLHNFDQMVNVALFLKNSAPRLVPKQQPPPAPRK